MKVRLTPEALNDLRDIGDRIAADNPERAASFAAELTAKCLDLGSMPERFALVDRYAKKGIRKRLHQDYLIFYRIEAAHVTVLRVTHGARNYGQILGVD